MENAYTMHRADTLGECTPLQCYMALRAMFGERDAFILESLAGPARDVKMSVLGFNRLAEVGIKGGSLTVSATPAIASRLDAWSRSCPHITPDGAGHTIEPGKSWDVLRSLHKEFARDDVVGLGFLVFLSYDAAWHIETLPHIIPDNAPDLPDISMVLWRGIVTFDAEGHDGLMEQFLLDGVAPVSVDGLNRAIAAMPAVPDVVAPPRPRSITDSCTQADFVQAAQACLEHIAAGDIYQIQLGHELRIASDAAPFDTYLRLRAINPSPYMSFAPLGPRTIIGASPELFVRKQSGTVTMRPIAGTRRRTGDPERDARNAEILANDEKEKAEHIMLIDLCRNDVGRACVPGTLDVNEQMVVEHYSHVLHLVSNVQAELLPGLDIFDLIPATFPAGTMTGAPKVRAMELIESFETSRRGLYAGALGIISLNGDAVLSLTIRTAVHADGIYSIRASAGIVADSVPEAEWQETLNKLAAGRIAITGDDFDESYRGGCQ